MDTIDDRPQFAILAPHGASAPLPAISIRSHMAQYVRLLGEMQRLRGRVALREGAITASMMDSSGRYVMDGDLKSWHLLRLHNDGQVVGCARLLVHPCDVKFHRLRIAASSLAQSTTWKSHVQAAVEGELKRARRNGQTLIEPGGWVVDECVRGTCEAVYLAIAAFAWAQILGDCIGFLTATEKHGSSTILRRLGGRSLESEGQTIPRYFEPKWGCNAELLRFDTNSLDSRFAGALEAARSRLRSSPTYCAVPDRAPENVRLPLSPALQNGLWPSLACLS